MGPFLRASLATGCLLLVAVSCGGTTADLGSPDRDRTLAVHVTTRGGWTVEGLTITAELDESYLEDVFHVSLEGEGHGRQRRDV